MSRTKSAASLRVEELEGRLVPAVSLPNPGTGGVATMVPAIPALSSNPGAAATVYLDFDGHRESDWGGVFVGPLRFGEYDNATAPPFDLDGNRAAVSESERVAIRNIWTRVSEDFAPFNVNVTTVNPGDFSNGRGLRVAIGGVGEWLGRSAGGVAMINSFTSRHENVAWVFSDGFGNHPANIAKTVTHEAGHAFGLEHYPQPDPANPSSLPNNPFPLMRQGHDFTDTTRTVWAAGRNTEGDMQDDMAVLAGTKNGFGYRADDHAGFAAAATWLNPVGGVVQRSGVIERNGDADMFAFWSGGGQATFSLTRATHGPNLDARLELRDARGNTIASTTANTLPANLPRGVVYAVVSSTGGYGNVGQYLVKGMGISSAGYATTGPRVIHGTAPVVSRMGSATLYLAFDKPMAASTVSSFVLMAGLQQLRTLRVESMPGDHGGRYFRIHVGLPHVGSYSLKLGAGVKDVFGNRLDQNGDGVQGDAFGVSIRRIPLFGTA